MQRPRLSLVSPTRRNQQPGKGGKPAAKKAAAKAKSRPGADALLELSDGNAGDGGLERALAGPRADHVRSIDLRRNHNVADLLHPLPRYPRLRIMRLDLSDNRLRSLEPVASMQFLESLVASDNAVERLPRDIGKLLALRELRLERNELCLLSDLERLRNCTNLTTLALADNPLTEAEHYRAWTVHQIRTLNELDGEAVLEPERADARARFEAEEVAALRGQVDELERRMLDAHKEKLKAVLQLEQSQAQRAAASPAQGGEGPAAKEMSLRSTPASLASFEAVEDLSFGQDVQSQSAAWSSPITVIGAGDLSAAGTVVGEPRGSGSSASGGSKQRTEVGDAVAQLCATIGDGLAQQADCDALCADALAERWSVGSTELLHGYEGRVLRLLKREKRDLKRYLRANADAADPTDPAASCRMTVAAVQSSIVTQTIDMLRSKGSETIEPRSTCDHAVHYIKLGASANESLRDTLVQQAADLRGDETADDATLKVKKWQAMVRELQLAADSVPRGEESDEQSEDEESSEEPSLSLAWRSLLEPADKTEASEKLEGELQRFAQKNAALEQELSQLTEASTARLDALRNESEASLALAKQRAESFQQEAETLREQMGLMPGEELQKDNTKLRERLAQLERQHATLEEEHAAQLDEADALRSEHERQLHRAEEKHAEQLRQSEIDSAQQLEHERSSNAEAQAGANKVVEELEAKISQL